MEFQKKVTRIKAVNEKEYKKKIRVGAYCRVSTDSDDQVDSFVAQVRYYTDLFKSQEEFELVDIYADEGITGTSTEKRDDFMRMLKDSQAGKLDRIYVKSVSRFARNSIDCVSYARQLRANGTIVYFENDGINTATMNNELVLYIKSAFAQAESIAASRRLRRSNQMRMETGNFAFMNAPFGYKIENDMLIPIPEEVEIVRKIYKYYLSGMGFGKIVVELNNDDTAVGKPWGKERVRYILSNEKYIGDTLYQKTYTPTELPFRNIRNDGEVDRFYVIDSHEAVIDKETFNRVQEMIKRNHEENKLKAKPQKYNFTKKLYCVDCNWAYKKRVQNGITYWACAGNGTAGRRCSTHPLSEEVIKRTFCKFYNRIRQHEDEFKSIIFRLSELKTRITKQTSEIASIDAKLLEINDRVLVYEDARRQNLISQEIFDDIVASDKKQIAELRSKRQKYIDNDFDEKSLEGLRNLISFFEESPKAIIKFNQKLFNGIVERIVVMDNDFLFELRCGLEIKEAISWN